MILGAAVLIAAFIVTRYMNDFSRVRRVEIVDIPAQEGGLGKVLLSNNQSSKVEFALHCYFKVRSDGKALFTESISIPPKGSVEFDVNPELVGKELPRIIANKACEAIWQGPFGIKRSAWWLSWQYRRPTHKAEFR